MIKLEIFQIGKHSIVYIDEKTMSVCRRYFENITSDQSDQTITLLQKTIDSICNMTFSITRRYPFKSVRGETDWVHINFTDDGTKWVTIDLLKDICILISYDDFKKLLMAQHKENEVAYLLLQGVIT